MALVIADRVRETTTTTGTGTLTLAGPYTGFQAFSVIGNGNTTYYAIVDASTGSWEVGIGTYTASGNTLSRDTILSSSNSGSAVNFGAGTKDVILTQPSERAVVVQSGGSGLQTGVASFTANGVPYANSTSTLATGSGLTFDGTTLVASNISTAGSTTLSGGTANGVAYLNGSKVLTSGSALTFDGTTLNTSAGTPIIKATASTTNALYGLEFNGGALDAFVKAQPNNSELRIASGRSAGWGGFTSFYIDTAEQMRLTSTGLGIGTSSPGAKVHARVVGSGSNLVSRFEVDDNSGTNNYLDILPDNTTNLVKFKSTGSVNGGFLFSNASTDFLTIDRSGNLGLGVTPSAWNASIKALQLVNGSQIAFSGAYGALQANAYYDAGGVYRYIASGVPATIYQQAGGQHWWQVAPSGTAGNAISFTQAMTLDASGRLGVGITSPGTKFSLQGGSSIADASMQLLVSGNVQNQISFSNGYGQREGVVFLGDGSSGNTSFGVISTQQALTFQTAAFNIGGASDLSTGWTERARIDSSGNLLVGTTSTGVASGGVAVLPSAGQTYISIGHISGTGSGSYYLPFIYNGSIIGGVTQNGTTGVLYNLTSDYRLKNNPVALTGAKAFVMALQPKTWDWWDGSGKGVGFIAHEFMEVAKYSGNGTKDAVDAEGKPVYQSIQPSSSEVMANLVALIQEQQNTIDQLKARLDAANL